MKTIRAALFVVALAAVCDAQDDTAKFCYRARSWTGSSKSSSEIFRQRRAAKTLPNARVLVYPSGHPQAKGRQ
jgi:hypothetical protein